MTLAKSYATDALAHSGFVIQHFQLAARLRPDLFSSHVPFGLGDVVAGVARGRGAKLYHARAEGFEEPVIVWAVSAASLAQRIEWITGLKVSEVIPVVDAERPPEPVYKPPSPYEIQLTEKKKRNEELAAMELPNYDGPHRREILEARRALGMEVV